MANQNISWVEPNSIYSDNSNLIVNGINNDTYRETIPPMENYCIAVDLEVEIPERGKGGVSTPSKTILVSWSATNEGKTNVSFFEGTKFKFGNKETINYLSTNPTTFGTFEEVKNIGTNECFGINSIDIQYNSYMVPEVTIEFTDIRGISLFSPEELRHSAVNEEGIGGMVNTNDNIAGSFFKCFFTFPYPKFKLMVKGFYGEPTSYELTVSDFRTRFNCETGNFNATAKFVGYAYSLLNDVTMNALVVAPLNEYVGEKYWNDNISGNNPRFSFTDGTPMLRFDEILSKVKSIQENIEKASSESEFAKKAQVLSIENNKINQIVTANNNLYLTILNYFKSMKLEGVNNPLTNSDKKAIVLFLKKENITNVKATDDIITANNTLKQSVSLYGNNLFNYLPFQNEVEFKISPYNEKIDTIKSLIGDYSSILGINFSESNEDWYVAIYECSNLESQIKAIKSKNDNEITENEKKLSKIKKEAVIKALGFNPTVENITKLVFAHFETLIHTIYTCVNNIGKRTPLELGITTTDLNNDKNGNNVGPFPRIDVETIYNGVKTVEEGWLGELQNATNEQEVHLIEGLLKAVIKFQPIANEASQNLSQSGGSENNETVMEIPLTPLDIVMSSHPFESGINFDNISDFIGKIGLRMFSVIGLHDGIIKSGDYTKMGIADAYNFYAKFPKIGKKFLDRLCGSEQALNTPLLFSCLKNENTEERQDEKWAWDSNNSDKSQAMIKGNNLALYDVNIKDNIYAKILPITNIDWDEINTSILLGKIPKNLDNFISTKYLNIKAKDKNNVFILDKNYEKYSCYATKMSVNNEPFNYVSDLKLSFNCSEYIEEFFYDDDRFFSMKFSKNNEANFIPFEGSHILPFERQITLKEAKESTSFKNSTPFNSNFDTIKCNVNGSIKTIKRNNDSSFSSISSDIENTLNYTIPSFRGVNKNNDFTNEWSLFGQLNYYDIPEVNGRALVFLDSLKLKEEGYNFGGIRFGDYSFDGDKNVTKHILNKNEPFMIMPYLGLLLLGGYFWRENYINEKKIEPLGTFIEENKRCKPYESVTYSIEKELFSLRQEIKDVLINEFLSWVESDTGFKSIQSNFELYPKNSQPLKENFKNQYDFVKKLIEKINNDIENVEEFLWENASDSFYTNYISFKVYDDNIKLFNRETSSALDAFITHSLLKPYMVIKPTKFIYNNENSIISTNGNGTLYLNGFLTKLKELYKNSYETSKQEPNPVVPIQTNEHIKINLYKYIKILYDKWLSGYEEKDWSLENFYDEHWYFLDAYYNKIGDRVLINILNLCKDIIYSQEKESYSLLSFISKSYAVDRFHLYCIQNFMDLSNDEEEEKFKRMFKAIPYNEINFNNISFHPSFILLYSYEYSSKLDIEGADYKSDSYNLDDDDAYLPTQITTKNLNNGYKIPAFAVTYGKQYQHYFKNIDISTDNPIVTEEAIKTQFMIAGMHTRNGQNGKKIEFLAQDLYTIYSNNSYTCTIKMMGCAWIQPLMYFQLNNVPMFRGAYLIQKVSHHIEPGNMETTFVGVRMAKQSTKIVEDPLFVNDNDQTAPSQVQDIIENTLAEVTNDCKYAFYNPNIDLDLYAMPEEDLNLTLEQYAKKYNSEWNSVVTNSSSSSTGTVQNLLANIINGEARNQSTLGKQLVATVLFNRYMHFGKNLTKMFWDSQHELEGSDTDDEDKKIAREIFLNSPSILKGQLTNVEQQIPILYEGKPTGNLTQSVALTIDMLKTMDGYCTIRGYNLNDNSNETKEPKGWWHDVKYVCQDQKRK